MQTRVRLKKLRKSRLSLNSSALSYLPQKLQRPSSLTIIDLDSQEQMVPKSPALSGSVISHGRGVGS